MPLKIIRATFLEKIAIAKYGIIKIAETTPQRNASFDKLLKKRFISPVKPGLKTERNINS